VKVPEPENEQPLAWRAVLVDTPVRSSDGEDIGGVQEVLGAEDIFHGIVVRSGPLSHEVMIPAQHVVEITNRRIETDLNAEQIRALPPYQEEESYQLGFIGILRRRMGWVDEDSQER
jgi:hypothetical protein